MGRQACLAIGISDAPPLDYLPGAVNGAHAIARWAKQAGYETAILTDEDNPVGIAEIEKALENLLPKNQKTDRLIIYFAGHGLARAAFEDLWLISQWFDEQRAVSIEGLRARLSRFGVDQVAIISDACRSLAANADTAELVADSVLGRGPFDRANPSVDSLKASSKYRAAYMIPGESEADDRCIFTGVLEDTLWGRHDEAFDGFRAGDVKCITSGSLARFLRTEVPRKAQLYSIELDPDIQPGFEQPHDVYVSAPVANAPQARAWPPATSTASMSADSQAAGSGKRGWSTRNAAAASEPVEVESAGSVEGGDGGGGLDLDWDSIGGPLDGPGSFSSGFGRVSRRVFKPVLADDDFGFRRGSVRGGSGGRPAPRKPAPSRRTLKQVAVEERARAGEEERRQSSEASRILQTYGQERPPTHFETGAGVSLAGAEESEVHVGAGASTRFDPGIQIGFDPPRPGWPVWSDQLSELVQPVSVLVELKTGAFAGAAALPGFMTRMGFEASRSDLAYERTESLILSHMGRPSGNSDAERAIAELRAGVIDRTIAVDFAVQLRAGKHDDPVLGVIAAYMYNALGDVDGIRQTAYYFARAGQAIPYDIALLADVDTRRDGEMLIAEIPPVAARTPRTRDEEQSRWAYGATEAIEGTVAGDFPWFRQGWSLLEAADPPLVDKRLFKIRAGLLPGTFTTLRPTAGRQLLKLIRELGQ